MFTTKSMSGIGWVILILGMVSGYFELDLDEAQITEIATASITTFGFIVALVGHVMRKDLSFGIWRK